jgi:hypothetical protein
MFTVRYRFALKNVLKGYSHKVWTYFERKNLLPQLRPQSANWKTVDGIQNAETHFFAQVFFKIIIILGLTI